jgi:Rrf2 family iron-sulfur cluster assembly transcriptional regulator
MQLTTKGRYAVTAVIDLAVNSKSAADGLQTPISLNDIAERQNISLSYLEQIFLKLKSYGIVKSLRGVNGGYILAKAFDEINMADIINAVDESIKMTRCGVAKDAPKTCTPNNAKCLTHELWEGLENQIEDYLKSVTIKDITEN